jgi:hypothetical protein
MSDSPGNPYRSPSAAGDEQRGLRQPPPKPDFFWPIVLNALILIAMLASQGALNRWLEAREAALPFSTSVALGPVLPSILAASLLATIAARRRLRNERYRRIWEFILTVLLGVVAGYYAIALLLAFAGGPVPLT